MDKELQMMRKFLKQSFKKIKFVIAHFLQAEITRRVGIFCKEKYLRETMRGIEFLYAFKLYAKEKDYIVA